MPRDTHIDDDTLLRYRYETLEREEADAVSTHLRTCTECTSRFADLGRQLDLLGTYDAEADLPEDLPARVLQQVHDLERERQAQATRQAAELARTEAEAAAREAQQVGAAAMRLAQGPLDTATEKRQESERKRPGFWAWLGLQAGGSLRAVRLAATLATLAGVSYIAGGMLYHRGVPRIDTRVSGEDVLIPGSRSTLLVQVVDRLSQHPVASADVRVTLRGPGSRQVWKLFQGQTDPRGLCDPAFDLPDVEDGDYRLEIATRGAGESDTVLQPIRFHRAFKVHLSTDKPLYQPGQTIHIRTLVLQRPTLTPPAGREVVIEAIDPRGNRVMREKVAISKYGVGAHALELADDLRLGQYRIRAIIDGARGETAVKVARYTLPKFKITAKPDKPFYLAGETLHLDLKVRYFFGKAVAKGDVRAVLFRPDGSVLGQEITGKTDADGQWRLEAELPASLAAAGSPETVMMELAVKDVAGQEERKQQSVTVTRELLQMEVIPEGGQLVTGMENTLFVLTTSPDGQALPARVEITFPDGKVQRVQTHDNGLGVLRYTPPAGSVSLQLRGEDREGRRGSRTVALSGVLQKLVVATRKAFVAPGDTVHIGVQAIGQFTAAVVEGVQEGQTVFRARFGLDGGKGSTSVDLPPGISGTIRLDVQGVDPYDMRSPVVSRKIVVADRQGLKVTMTTDKPTFRPGAQVRLRFKVTGPDGNPKAAAIGLFVVDESVFALASSRPALARAFFLLEQSLMEARHHLSAPDALTGGRWGEAEQAAGRLLLSLDRSGVRPQRFVSQSYEAKAAGIQLQRAQFEENAVLVGVGIGLVLVLVLVVAAARRLPAWAGGILLALGAGIALMIPLNMVYVLGVLAGGVLIALLVHHQASGRVGWALVLIPALGVGAVWWLEPTAPRTIDLSRQVAQTLSGADVVLGARSNAQETPAPKTGRFKGEEGKLGEAQDAPARLASRAEPRRPAAPQAAREAEDTLGGLGRSGTGAAPHATVTAAIPRREVRVRRHFPETMFVHPELVTDEQGVAELTIPVADSITEWRVSALASSADGKLGAMDAPLKVFQDFFVDLDMPVALVRGDEVSIPVAVYNYLDETQTVRLELKQEGWFQTIGPARLAVKLPASGVDGREVRIRVLQAGRHRLSLRADGTRLSDALARELLVSEAGQERSDSASGTLRPGETTRVTVQVPDAAVKGTSRLMVKLFPSRLSSALDGLENSLQTPHGCFEQTSSATYPNVLIYDYLKRAGKLTPAFEKRARQLIGLGYQRLLRFEVRGGGFEWFGRAPANQILTAYGLMEFSDMSRVFPVDRTLIQRTQRWLVGRQQADGSWLPDQRSLSDGLWRSEFNGRLMVTAYLTWSLAESGYRGPALGRAFTFLAANIGRMDDAYTLALVTAASARASARDKIAAAATQLESKANTSEAKLVSFRPAGSTAYYGRGKAGGVETTALAAYALTLLGRSPPLVQGALAYLAQNRDHRGTWHSTQGTILALRALLAGAGADRDQRVTIRINGQEAGTHGLKAGSDQPVLVDLGPRARQGVNVVELAAQAAATFQVVAIYTLPWQEKGAEDEQPLSLKVDYDRAKVNVGGIVPVEVRLTYRRPEASGMVLLSLGLPAGLVPLPEDLQALVSSGTVACHELAADRINLYIDRLASASPLSFKLRMKARVRVHTRGVGSLAYLYYHPEIRAVAAPSMIVVN